MASGTVRTFRIFISSTFSDLVEERNALQKVVFPALRDLCRRHGCRIQPIDLRWGVREEAALDQQTMRICLEEIAHSRKISPKPNFIVLLGDRYGWQPLPAAIPAAEFEALLSFLAAPEDRELLNLWYRRDDNAVPAEFRLLPRIGEYADPGTWESLEKRLLALLRGAAQKAPLAPADRVKYEASATEQEILAGALKVEDAADHVFCYFRTVSGLPRSGAARDILDLDEGGSPDAAARTKLDDLKGRLRSLLPGPRRGFRSRVDRERDHDGPRRRPLPEGLCGPRIRHPSGDPKARGHRPRDPREGRPRVVRARKGQGLRRTRGASGSVAEYLRRRLESPSRPGRGLGLGKDGAHGPRGGGGPAAAPERGDDHPVHRRDPRLFGRAVSA